MRNLEKRKSDKAEEVQTEADFVKEQAMQQYEKYRRVEPSERGTAMFDEMLRLKRENMILEDENKTLKKKLQKYGVPSSIKWVDEIPLNKNGKVDIKKLYSDSNEK